MYVKVPNTALHEPTQRRHHKQHYMIGVNHNPEYLFCTYTARCSSQRYKLRRSTSMFQTRHYEHILVHSGHANHRITDTSNDANHSTHVLGKDPAMHSALHRHTGSRCILPNELSIGPIPPAYVGSRLHLKLNSQLRVRLQSCVNSRAGHPLPHLPPSHI
jgi:hypothetical protein